MERTAVKSSQIAAIGYDPASRVLAIEFHSGAIYEYDKVRPEQYAALIAAPSIGRAFGAGIRLNPEHPSRKVRDRRPAPPPDQILEEEIFQEEVR